MSHHTVTYHGDGRYTLTADAGYVLQNTSGEQYVKTETKDYTQWTAVEGKPKRVTRRKSKQ